MLLSDAVGRACLNRSCDVKMVQLLVNMNLGRIPGTAALKVDGQFGPASLEAIVAFLTRAMGQSSPDGVVAPGGDMLAELRRGLPGGLTAEKFHFTMLNAKSYQLELFYKPMVDRMQAAQINTPLRWAHFLAQTGHESGDLQYLEELASGQAYEGRADLGNAQPGDGVRFKGRGLIQLTGRVNYVAYGRCIGLDLTVDGNWNKVATDPALAVDVACWFWNKHGLNELADRDDLQKITRRVNGGLIGIEDRADHLERAEFVLLPALAGERTPSSVQPGATTKQRGRLLI
jgi:putative chitinase